MYAAISLTVDGIKDRKQILCYPVHNFVYRTAKKKQTHRQMLTSINEMIVLILFVTDINCSFKNIFIYLATSSLSCSMRTLVEACRLGLSHLVMWGRSSLTRDRTRVPSIARQLLTRKVPKLFMLKRLICIYIG